MQVQDWPISKIRPYPNNPRVLRNAAEKVAESIRAFGWRQPIVVDDEGVIIIGHARYAAANLMKLASAPVHVATGLSADQVRALRVADNKTSEFAQWDEAKLADELAEIMASLGTISVTGFSQSEFDSIEMQSKAAMQEIQASLATPSQRDDAEEYEEQDQPDRKEAGDDMPDDEPGELSSDDEDTDPGQDMVPFNVLMTADNRQIVYEAVSKAKQNHELATTADALLVIARSYLNA